MLCRRSVVALDTELFEPELPDSFEHSIAQPRVDCSRFDQIVLGQPSECSRNLSRRHAVVCRYRQSICCREGPAKRAHSREHVLVQSCEQSVAPRDGVADRPVAGLHARSANKQTPMVAQTALDAVEADRCDSCRRKFDRERHSVESPTDVYNSTSLATTEFHTSATSALHEQLDRSVRTVSTADSEAAQLNHLFVGNSEADPTRQQEGCVRTRRQDSLHHEGNFIEDLFAVVEYQESFTSAQHVQHGLFV